MCLSFGECRQKINMWNLCEYLQAQAQFHIHRNVALSLLPLVLGQLIVSLCICTAGLQFFPMLLLIWMSSFERANKLFRQTIPELSDFWIGWKLPFLGGTWSLRAMVTLQKSLCAFTQKVWKDVFCRKRALVLSLTQEPLHLCVLLPFPSPL